MSWKPNRGNGIVFETALQKAYEHRNEVRIMIEEQDYLKFSCLNKFSKHIYLHYVNEKKIGRASIEYSAVNQYYLDLMIKHKSYLYKPMQRLLNELKLTQGRSQQTN